MEKLNIMKKISLNLFWKIFFAVLIPLAFTQCEKDCDHEATIDEQSIEEEELSIEDELEVGLLLYLPFNGDGKDLVNPEHLTILKNCEFANDHEDNPNQAIALNGVNSYIDIINPISKNQKQFSLSFWMKNQSLSDTAPYIFCLRDNSYINIRMDVYDLSITPAYKYRFNENPKSITETQAHVWEYIVLVFDSLGKNMTVFINGEKKQTTPVKDFEAFREGGATVGSAIGCHNRANEESGFWEGLIDEVRIYNRPLSIQEIEYLYNH